MHPIAWYRVFPLAIAVAALPLMGADSASDGHFWSELPPPAGHFAKAQSAQPLPDFSELAAKLSPAVVNITSEEGGEAAQGGSEEKPHGKAPHNPFEEFSPHSK